MNYTRNTKGQYSSFGAKVKRIYTITVRSLLIIGIVWAGIAIYNHENKPVENVQNVQQFDSELQQVMSREDLQKQYELMAREVLLKEKKAKIEAEYQTSISAINAELEEVRSQKVGF
jgi:predicted kinase